MSQIYLTDFISGVYTVMEARTFSHLVKKVKKKILFIVILNFFVF